MAFYKTVALSGVLVGASYSSFANDDILNIGDSSCGISDFLKTDCKYNSRYLCERNGCCWKPAGHGSTIPWCYYKKRKGPGARCKLKGEPNKPFSSYEMGQIRALFEANLDIQGSGLVVGAPDHNTGAGGDYYFAWVRDSALSMQAFLETAEFNARIDSTMESWLKAVERFFEREDFDRRNLLAEPKFIIPSGEPYSKPWCRPQSDGPILRVITLLAYVEKKPSIAERAWGPIWKTLDWVSKHYKDLTCDLWQEIQAFSFFWNDYVMRKALFEGSRFAAKMGDAARASSYEAIAKKIEATLPRHVESDGYVSESDNRKADAAVLEAFNLGDMADGLFAPLSKEVVSTFVSLTELFCREFGINQRAARSGTRGVLYGRYLGDKFAGGNAWILLSASAATLLYRQSEALSKGASLSLEVSEMLEAVLGQPVSASSLLGGGDSIFHLLKSSLSTGMHMREQVGREDGELSSAKDHTWTYANVLKAMKARDDAEGALFHGADALYDADAHSEKGDIEASVPVGGEDVPPCSPEVQERMKNVLDSDDMKDVNDNFEYLQKQITANKAQLTKQEMDAQRELADVLAQIQEKAKGIPPLEPYTCMQTSKKFCSEIFGSECQETKCGMTDKVVDVLNYNPTDTKATVEWPLERLSKAVEAKLAGPDGQFAHGKSIAEALVQGMCKSAVGFVEEENLQSNCKAFCQAFAAELKKKENVPGMSALEQSKTTLESEIERIEVDIQRCQDFEEGEYDILKNAVAAITAELSEDAKNKQVISQRMKQLRLTLKQLLREERASRKAMEDLKLASSKTSSSQNTVQADHDNMITTRDDLFQQLDTVQKHISKVGKTFKEATEANDAAEQIKLKLIKEIHSFVEATDKALLEPVSGLLSKAREAKALFPNVHMIAEKVGLERTGKQIVARCLAGKSSLNETAQLEDMQIEAGKTNSTAVCPWHGEEQRMMSDVKVLEDSARKLQSDPGAANVPTGVLGQLVVELTDEQNKARNWGNSVLAAEGVKNGELEMLAKLEAKFANTEIFKEYFQFWAASGSGKKYFVLMMDQLALARQGLEAAGKQLKLDEAALKEKCEAAVAAFEKLQESLAAAKEEAATAQAEQEAAEMAASMLKGHIEAIKAQVDQLREMLKAVSDEIAKGAQRFKAKYEEKGGRLAFLEMHEQEHLERVGRLGPQA
eukprot:TRINITY_DN537_c0_g3_i1.p1 TRINITY_DN537_c0_g3~~TRINITY_DN537_c0_g3_i1.p1  ORF type:complete len:1180 (-),score=363.91 TRINITY_DN537_c0_g3_i1:308-3847(-)